MPQLNPAPWFKIAVITWLLLLTLIPLKLMNYYFPYDPSPQDFDSSVHSTEQPWKWQWY
nr:ATPase subunits 8 [Paraulopus oblongus]